MFTGVAALIKCNFLIKSYKYIHIIHIHCLSVILMVCWLTLLLHLHHIFNCYVSSTYPIMHQFGDEFSDLIHSLDSTNYLIFGDFNYHFSSTETYHAEFTFLIYTLSLSQHVLHHLTLKIIYSIW